MFPLKMVKIIVPYSVRYMQYALRMRRMIIGAYAEPVFVNV